MKRVLKNLLALSLILALMLPFTACTSSTTTPTATPDTTENGGDNVLRVGMECAYAPFNWTQSDDSNGAVAIDDGSGYAAGYDVEIAKLIAQGLGKELVIVKTAWTVLIPALTSGKIDLIIAGMSPTAERRETIDFSDYYYDSDLVIVVMGSGDYADAASLADFAGAKITGQLGTVHYDVVDQIEGVDKQTAMEDFATMIVALTSGRIDGYVAERPGAISNVASNPELIFVSFEEGGGFEYTSDEISISVGLRKGSELTAQINEILAGVSEETREELMENAIANQPE